MSESFFAFTCEFACHYIAAVFIDRGIQLLQRLARVPIGGFGLSDRQFI
jgi:hypothetical protein